MNRNFWLCLCLLFAAYNLTLLVQDRNSVHFFTVDEENHTNFLICFRPEEIHGPASWPKVNLSEHLRRWKLNVSDQLSSWKLNVHLEKSVQLLNWKLNSSKFFHSNESYLFGTKSCFLLEKSKLERLLSAGVFVSKFKMVLFAFSDGSLPLWANAVYTKFFGNDLIVKLQKQKVFGEAHLERNCLGARNQLAANKYNCVNECHKKKRTRNCLYSYDELPNLRYGDLNWANETHEQFCLESCPDAECFYEDYEVVEMRKDYYERHLASKGEKVEIKTTTYRAQYAITDFHFQFLGLLTLLTGTSLIRLLNILINKLRSSIKNDTKKGLYLNRFVSTFRLSCILVLLLFSFYKSFLIAQDFRSQLNYPNKVITLNSKLDAQPLSLFVCFPIDMLIVKDRRFNAARNQELSKKFSFQALKEKTNLADEELYWIWNNFGGRRIQLNLVIADEALFKNSSEGNRNYLSRCFRHEIAVDEHRYKRMIPIQQLAIGFSTFHWDVYLAEKRQPFTSDLIKLKGEFRIAQFKQLNTRTSKNANCLNYEQAENCSTRQHCVDSCITGNFYEKHRSLTVHSVLNEDQVENQLNTSAFFNLTRDREIESQCLKRFESKDCHIARFDESSKATYAASGQSLSLNLNFEIVTEKEIDASPFKAVLEILNLLGILFGTNAPGLFALLLLLLRRLVKFEERHKCLFVCFCLLGFSAHNYLIFREIIQNDLFENAYFEKIKKFDVPNLIFCFEWNEKIDPNVALTGHYLDKLTSHLSYEHFFHSVDYYDEKDAHRFFRLTNANHSNSLFHFSRFYFLKLKCFELAYKMTYSEDEFLTKPGRFVYFVYFNASSQQEYVYVSTKQGNSKEFSPFSKLKIRALGKKGAYFYRYRMKFEVSELVVEDKFEVLKNPSSLFYEKSDINDPTKYLVKMERKFERNYGLATREILLGDEDFFGLPIEDDLFEQFYLQVQNISDHLPSSLNTKQTLFKVYTPGVYTHPKFPQFSFTITFFKKVLKVGNEENYTKLVQSLLNALSIWFDLTILELFDTFKDLSKFLSKHLLKYVGQFKILLIRLSILAHKRLVRLKIYCRKQLKMKKPARPATKPTQILESLRFVTSTIIGIEPPR